ncbi:MAG: tetratricopeptide repeat protein [Bdellovibrionota bacterium]|jgi:tetratricopeptide (TPR) repeat protein
MSNFITRIFKHWFAGIFVSQGLTYLDKEEIGYARSEFQRALRIAPDLYRARYYLGLVLRKEGKNAEALEELSAAIDLKPKLDSAWQERALVKLDLGDIDGAIEDSKKALSLKEDLQNYLALGTVYTKAQNLEEAEQVLRKAVQFDPKNAAAQARLGDCLSEQGRLEEAQDAFKESVKANPKNGLAFAKLARVTEKLGDYKEALTLYTRASFLDPQNAGYRCSAARVAEKDGDVAGAIISYQEAVKLDPECLTALVKLCAHARQVSDFEKARSYAERMLSSHPEDWEPYFQMALIAVAEEDKASAKELLKKARSLNREGVEAALKEEQVSL